MIKGKKRKFHQLNRSHRIIIEDLLNKGNSVKFIADRIGVHRNTIYNEIKRGQYEHRNSDYTEEIRYSCDIAQLKADYNKQMHGKGLKIGNDIELANFIEKKIKNEKCSPYAVIQAIEKEGERFQTRICEKTIYNYVHDNVFYELNVEDLPRAKKKRKKGAGARIQKRSSAGAGIDERPKEIESREEFGHWEMDTVVGKRKGSKEVLLALTERKSRENLFIKIENKKCESVVSALNELEKEWKQNFKTVFKTITVDNGTEFADCDGIEKSNYDESTQRTKVYYCHAYSSWERGSNENQNAMARRWFPKGTDFGEVSDEEIKAMVEWLNHYPRRILNGKCAEDIFRKELEALKIA